MMITLVALFMSGDIGGGRVSEQFVDPGYTSMAACVAAGDALKRQHSQNWHVTFSCLRKR